MALIRFGTAERLDLGTGDRLVIAVASGNQAGDLSFPGFDSALSRDINGIVHYGRPVMPYLAAPGMHLYDGEGEPVIEVGPIGGDGGNDIMLPGCRREIYGDGRLGCRDLISAALGMRRGELTGMLSFFCVGAASEDYYDGLVTTSAVPGLTASYIALGPVAVAVSAYPGTDIPGSTPGALEVTIEPPSD